MNLLLTGANGFIGREILPQLRRQYTNVTTLGTRSGSADIISDISKEAPEIKEYHDIVVHAAGKAHMTVKSDEHEEQFYSTNYIGTKNLCYALEQNSVPKYFVFISTVAVYGCEEGEAISEEHPLQGMTPYAKSKILAEEFLIKWCSQNKVTLSILRLSLVAGNKPPGNLKSMISGINRGIYFNIDNGKARKSIVMVHDISKIIPLVSEIGGIYNICDSYHPSFSELSALIAKQLGKHKPLSIPLWVAQIIAKCGDLIGDRFPLNTHKLKKITQTLTFSNYKAINILGWSPSNVLENFRIEDI